MPAWRLVLGVLLYCFAPGLLYDLVWQLDCRHGHFVIEVWVVQHFGMQGSSFTPTVSTELQYKEHDRQKCPQSVGLEVLLWMKFKPSLRSPQQRNHHRASVGRPREIDKSLKHRPK